MLASTAKADTTPAQVGSIEIIEAEDLQCLIDALKRRGYEVLGPTMRDGAIVYDALNSVSELPIGWTDEQEAGTYRLLKRDDLAFFGYNVGPHSWKGYLHPPVLRLWSATHTAEGFRIEDGTEEIPRRAFIGVRACELRAIEIQDRVFMGDMYVDPHYEARRENLFVVAVNCAQAGNTCFCTSTGSGPRAERGFDLGLTEILEGALHYFVVQVGSEAGAEILSEIPHRAATRAETERADALVANTAAHMGRELNTSGLKELLYASVDSPRWDEIAQRCLSCSNCTMVCPTCFCTTVEDVTDLTGNEAERVRKWDSCFTTDFSYIHGGSVRASGKSRYRQWMTHKLASWQDQFGSLGCVGCGRCITWCPVGIDITAEARAMRESVVTGSAEEKEN